MPPRRNPETAIGIKQSLPTCQYPSFVKRLFIFLNVHGALLENCYTIRSACGTLNTDGDTIFYEKL